jgi:hypothetical protein
LIPFYGAACALGALAGVAFALLWRRLVPRGTNRSFWSSMSELGWRMLEVEQTGEFLRLYRTLGGLVARYVGRNLGGTLVACLPMVAVLLTVAPLLFAAWDARAPRMALVPAEAAALVAAPAAVSERTGYCSTAGYCALFAALDFNVVPLKADAAGAHYVVVRADHGDINPLWPFLSDIEAAFFAAFIVATLAGLLWPLKLRS